MIKQKFFLDFGSKTLHYILQAIGGIIVARFAGPHILGTIAYGVAFAGTFNFINGLFGSAHIKIIADTKNKADCNTTFSILKLLSALLFVLVSLSFYFISNNFYQLDSENHIKEIVIFISIATVVIHNILKIPENIFIANMQQARSNIPYILHGIIYNIFRIVIAILGFGAIILSSIPLIVSLLILPLYIYFLKDISFGSYNKKLANKYLVLALPIFIIVFANTLSLNIGRLILESFTDTISLGLYTAGHNIAGIFGLVAGTAGTMFFPLFSKAVSNNENKKIINYILKYERFVFIWVFPILIFFSIFSTDIILLLLGEKYLASSLVFRIIILSSFLQILSVPLANLLFSFNKFNLAAFISISKLIIQVVLVLVLSHPKLFDFGIIGLALAILISNIFIFVIRYYYSRKILELDIIKQFIPYIMLGVILFFIFDYSINILLISNFYLMIIFIFVVYFTMILLKLLTMKDYKILLQIIDIKSFKKYINKETNIH